MRARSMESFKRLSLVLPGPATKVAGLSGGQRQAVAIAARCCGGAVS